MNPKIFIYIAIVLARKIGRFFTRWYMSGSRIYWHGVLDFYSELEQMVSLRITAANWYRPLYQDYSKLGLVIGIPLRMGRVIVSAVLYVFLLLFFTALFGVYLALPIFLLSRLV